MLVFFIVKILSWDLPLFYLFLALSWMTEEISVIFQNFRSSPSWTLAWVVFVHRFILNLKNGRKNRWKIHLSFTFTMVLLFGFYDILIKKSWHNYTRTYIKYTLFIHVWGLIYVPYHYFNFCSHHHTQFIWALLFFSVMCT